jgi:hypothetical protein
VSFIAVLLLLQISRPVESTQTQAAPAAGEMKTTIQLGAVLGLGLLAAALVAGWWGIYRSGDLLRRTDNPRRSISDLYVRRGAILDREDRPVDRTSGEAGNYSREYDYPGLSNVVGYTNPTYGQSGLEASQDEILRGLQGNRNLEIWWNRLVNGQPPPGLDIRLTLDMELQRLADKLFKNKQGAVVALNAQNGEALVMASYPGFDAGKLDAEWAALVNDPSSPLLNRATLGRYPVGNMEKSLRPDGLESLGVLPTPRFDLPTGDLPNQVSVPDEASRGYSPIQLALAAAAISGGGVRPAPQLVSAVHNPQSGWMPLQALSQPFQALTAEQAAEIARGHAVQGKDFWQVSAVEAPKTGKAVTWYLGGTLPDAGGTPYALALVIEGNDEELARQIGQALLQALQWGKDSG